MTIRISGVVMEKLGTPVTGTAAPEENPLCDWAIHLFRSQRHQYLLAVNTTSLFPVVLRGRGITSQASFLKVFLPALREQHRVAGLEEGFERLIGCSLQPVRWSKVGNRRVTGSMNEIIALAKFILEEADWNQHSITMAQLALELSGTILTFTAYHKLLESHRALMESQF
jgi:hypothetical protein